MTSNQRRPGFRLPWAGSDTASPETTEDTADAATPPASATTETTEAAEAEVTAPETAAKPADSAAEAPAAEPVVTADTSPPSVAPAADAAPAASDGPPPPAQPAASATATPIQPPPAAAAEPAAPATGDGSAGFMRDLVAAMRRVAEETRQVSLSGLRTRAEEQALTLEADADRRREELKARAERDVAAVAEWQKAEAERIRQEAERRVVARRAELDQQLAAETTRAEAEVQALRERVAAYERELDAYHARLSDISDPAAFASAAKQMPPPPRLDAPADASGSEPAAAPAPAAPSGAWATQALSDDADLTARLAELGAGPAEPASAGASEPTATEVHVTGLGSFGAITSFRQALAAADGIEGVSLSLGPTGEFVFRAIHPAGFDVAGAIVSVEGDGATVEPQADGSLKVTLTRSR